MEWRKVQRFYFVIYSVLIGPPLGSLLLFLSSGLYQKKWIFHDGGVLISLVFVAYAFGALQALLTALLIIWRYISAKAISVWGLLICSVIGWFFGNWLHYDFAFRLYEGRGFQFNKDTMLLMFAPLIFGLLMTYLVWYLRPKKWVGP